MLKIGSGYRSNCVFPESPVPIAIHDNPGHGAGFADTNPKAHQPVVPMRAVSLVGIELNAVDEAFAERGHDYGLLPRNLHSTWGNTGVTEKRKSGECWDMILTI